MEAIRIFDFREWRREVGSHVLQQVREKLSTDHSLDLSLVAGRKLPRGKAGLPPGLVGLKARKPDYQKKKSKGKTKGSDKICNNLEV